MNRLTTVSALSLMFVACFASRGVCASPPETIRIPRIEREPRIEDFLRGGVDSDHDGLAYVSAFTQEQPSDGRAPTQRTEVYLGYDDSRLYAIWECEDSNRSSIRAQFGPRDQLDPSQVYNDDFVELTIDTFHDQRHAFSFASNPLGIQTDALWTEDSQSRDTTWDERWESRGVLTDRGYVVLMAVPFKSIRFPPELEQTWGITLERYIARDDEIDYWPKVSSRISGRLNQEGTVTGLGRITPSRNVQITPYLYGRSLHVINDTDPSSPHFDNANLRGRAGGDIKWVLNENLVFDGTINPDFSQLESDHPQIAVNKRFQLYYPEKRPFFLENANFFDSAATGLLLSQLVFTRNIGDPEVGFKLSGKQGPWDLGVLFAVDRSEGESVPHSDPSNGKRAKFVIARLAHDLGKYSNVGFFYTNREFAGGFNRVGAIDTSVRLNQNWTGYVRGAFSATDCSNGSSLCLSGQTAYSELVPFGRHNGSNIEASLNGLGRRFRTTLQYQDITPEFHTDVGYVPRTDVRSVYGYYHFYFRPEGPRLINWGAETNLEQMWDHSGQATSYLLNLSPFVGLRRNTKFWFPILTSENETVRPEDFAGLSSNRRFQENSVGFDFETAPVQWLSFSTTGARQGTINFVPLAGQPPQPANEVTITSNMSYHIGKHLQLRNTYLFDRVADRTSPHPIFDDHIVRSEINYQHDARLGFRFIPQYNALLANSQYSSLTTIRSLNFDFLMTYLVHPGTAFYLGYNSNLENIAPGLCKTLPQSSTCDPNGGLDYVPGRLRNDGRQLFFKLTYQLRL